MKRTRNAAHGMVMGLAAAAVATLAVASVLVLTRFPVYERTSGSAALGTHVLVQEGLTADAGDLVVFHDSRRAGDRIGRMGADTAADSTLVGVVIRHGSLPSLVGYLLARAAFVGVPVGVLVGLLLGLGLPSRRRRVGSGSSPDDAAEPAAAPLPTQRAGDWDAAFGDEGLDLVLTGEMASRAN